MSAVSIENSGAIFVNLSILPELLPGCLVSDVPAVLSSLDFVIGECDRWSPNETHDCDVPRIASRLMFVLMLVLMLDSCSFVQHRIAKANVDQVTEGMSKKQVESILGQPTSSKTEDPTIVNKRRTFIVRAKTALRSFSRTTKCSRRTALSPIDPAVRRIIPLRTADSTARNAICRVSLRWVRFNDGRRDAHRKLPPSWSEMDDAIARYPTEHRRSAAMPLLHLWQEHSRVHQRRSHFLDRGKTRPPTDQHSRGGHVLSNVSPASGRENAYRGSAARSVARWPAGWS